MSNNIAPIRCALISVSDKTGIVDFAKGLAALNVTILSTGGTATLLQEKGIPVTEVSDHTGFPEIMAGRVKTLHPKIHGGILGRRGDDDKVMADHAIEPIDLVVVNLYPFAQTVARPDCDLATAIENIDIGGPTMVRAAAKNHAFVTIAVDCTDYPRLLQELTEGQGISQKTRFHLARKAFAHTALYDTAIANYLTTIDDKGKQHTFPQHFGQHFHKQQDLRYGENPHQQAAFYVDAHLPDAPCIATAQQHQGKALSYNNIADADAALECVKTFKAGLCYRQTCQSLWRCYRSRSISRL